MIAPAAHFVRVCSRTRPATDGPMAAALRPARDYALTTSASPAPLCDRRRPELRLHRRPATATCCPRSRSASRPCRASPTFFEPYLRSRPVRPARCRPRLASAEREDSPSSRPRRIFVHQHPISIEQRIRRARRSRWAYGYLVTREIRPVTRTTTSSAMNAVGRFTASSTDRRDNPSPPPAAVRGVQPERISEFDRATTPSSCCRAYYYRPSQDHAGLGLAVGVSSWPVRSARVHARRRRRWRLR